MKIPVDPPGNRHLFTVSVQTQCDTDSREILQCEPQPPLRCFGWTSRSLVESPWLQHLMRSSYVIDLNKWFVYLPYQSCSYKLLRAEHNQMSSLYIAPPWVTSANCSITVLQTCREKRQGGQGCSDILVKVFYHTLFLLLNWISCPHVPTRLVHLTKIAATRRECSSDYLISLQGCRGNSGKKSTMDTFALYHMKNHF